MFIENQTRTIGLILGIFIIFIVYISIFSLDTCCTCGITTDYCCPCPNDNYFEEVCDYYGHNPGGSGGWIIMCEDYKKEMNITFECFEQ